MFCWKRSDWRFHCEFQRLIQWIARCGLLYCLTMTCVQVFPFIKTGRIISLFYLYCPFDSLWTFLQHLKCWLQLWTRCQLLKEVCPNVNKDNILHTVLSSCTYFKTTIWITVPHYFLVTIFLPLFSSGSNVTCSNIQHINWINPTNNTCRADFYVHEGLYISRKESPHKQNLDWKEDCQFRLFSSTDIQGMNLRFSS